MLIAADCRCCWSAWSQIAKITLHLLHAAEDRLLGRHATCSTQQGVNFCDAGDPTVTAAINFGLTGTTDNSHSQSSSTA